jgi:hypothetical protein
MGKKPRQPVKTPQPAAEVVQDLASADNGGMSTAPTREEIDAKLAANVAEVKAVASEMRAEMTALRADNQAQFAALNATMASMQSFLEAQAAKTEAGFATLAARVEGSEKSLAAKIDGVEKGVEGKIDGLKSSMTTMQWVAGIVAALVAVWIGYLQLKQAEAPPTAPQSGPPVIINNLPPGSAPSVPAKK